MNSFWLAESLARLAEKISKVAAGKRADSKKNPFIFSDLFGQVRQSLKHPAVLANQPK
jgi:hypothetical protein